MNKNLCDSKSVTIEADIRASLISSISVSPSLMPEMKWAVPNFDDIITQ